jgi:hypothetical protein
LVELVSNYLEKAQPLLEDTAGGIIYRARYLDVQGRESLLHGGCSYGLVAFARQSERPKPNSPWDPTSGFMSIMGRSTWGKCLVHLSSRGSSRRTESTQVTTWRHVLGQLTPRWCSQGHAY